MQYKQITQDQCQSILHGIEIPAQPEILMSFKKECAQKDPDIKKIANIIAKDMAISIGILKTVNSPFFGLIKPVASILQAVTLLGLVNVSNLVFCLALKKTLNKGKSKFLSQFWDQSNLIALLCARIAKDFLVIAPDEAYTVGLMCDCGIPLIAQRFDDYEQFYEKYQFAPKAPFTIYEDKKYSTDHAVFGAFLARRWNLPKIITKIIETHHLIKSELDKIPSNERILDLLAIHLIAQKIYYKSKGVSVNGLEQSYEWFDKSVQALSTLNIDEDTLLDIEGKYHKLIDEFK